MQRNERKRDKSMVDAPHGCETVGSRKGLVFERLPASNFHERKERKKEGVGRKKGGGSIEIQGA